MARILICEDNASIRKVMRAGLMMGGHDLYMAEDGEQGLAMAENLQPDLIITDLSMPGLSGNELLDELRTRPGTAMTPVLVVTASAQPQVLADAIERGAIGFLVKPFSVSDLQQRIDAALAGLPAPRRPDEVENGDGAPMPGQSGP